ncbi:MAG: hypothetical protein ACTSVV_03090 [Promethearchaeota archaeon]
MIFIRAKACLKCHEYINVHPDNPISIEIEKRFEKKHAGHSIILVDLDEIKGKYTKFE